GARSCPPRRRCRPRSIRRPGRGATCDPGPGNTRARGKRRGMMTRSPCTGRGDVAASLVLIFPLLLAYEIGVLFAGRVNGADLVTRAVFAVAGSRAAYLAIYAVVAVG